MALALACAQSQADDVYFGGHGDTGSQWTGYSVQLSAAGLTNWTAYTLSRRGGIQRAPATVHTAGTNKWSLIFDEHIFTGNTQAYGLAKHELVVIRVKVGESVTVQDGLTELILKRMSPEQLKRVEKGGPNQAAEATSGLRPSEPRR